ncbi:protein bric-a-brac 2-like [Camponotus floridanus]|uniref:protein bric-a-brac 2-like n=1 Tax=Camponotus floridanus TaxID=104421 RepID=UPI000DC6C170|nr:protein bric-a-brac 2-like [Camponotus floridanus]
MKLSPGHHTLPRKKTLPLDVASRTTTSNVSCSGANAQQQQFQRGQPLRRSCLSPTQHHHQQQQHQQPPHHHQQHCQQESSLHFEYFVPRSVSEFNLAAAVTDMAVPPPPPASVLRPSSAMTPPVAAGMTVVATSQTRLLDGSSGGSCNTATRSREKMVTFEDEGLGVTSTPTRKNMPALDNVFM